jgi:hypothetical protein
VRGCVALQQDPGRKEQPVSMWLRGAVLTEDIDGQSLYLWSQKTALRILMR